MPPSAKSKNRRICPVCPKKKVEIPKIELPREEVEEEEEELLPEAEQEEIEEPCLDADGYGDFELVTSGHVLEEILPAKKKKKPAFFASCSEKIRYDNLIPCDITNDHQYKASIQKTLLDQMSMLRVTSDPRWKRVPAIVATIGPSCLNKDQIQDLMLSGMNVARINLAFGDRCCHLIMIRNVRESEKYLSTKMGFHTPIAVMVDLKGTQILTGRICRLYITDCSNPQIFLEKDREVKLTSNKYMADKCTPSLIYINYPELSKFVRPGMKIFLDNGAVKLVAQRLEEEDIWCTVHEEGYLGNNKNVHLPMIPMTIPPYTATDIEDMFMAIEEGVDIITLPNARHPSAVADIRQRLTEKMMIMRKLPERPIMLFAKITNYEGLANIDGLIESADGIVIQRVALGLDLPPEKVVIAQREIIAKCNLAGKPVVCSSQFVHSMLDKIQISSSDVSSIAECLHEGADCITLTQETAIGKYPNETIEAVNHIIREADASTYQKNYAREITDKLPPSMDPKIAVALAACTVAEKVRAPAIIVLTTSGKSAKLISWLRPTAVVIAITAYKRTARQMNLWRAIAPLYYKPRCTVDWFMDMEKKFHYGIAYGKEFGFIRPGDPVVLVSGYGKSVGYTNCVRVIYASTEPDVYLEHPLELYSSRYIGASPNRPQDRLPYTPCK